MKRCKGLQSLDLETSDWSTALPHSNGSLKSNVNSALRCSDVSLGVSSHGLTRMKTNNVLTKPHVFVQRPLTYKMLAKLWRNVSGDLETKNDKVHSVASQMWLCKLLQPNLFIQIADGPIEDKRLLITSAGPVAIQALKLHRQDGHECFTMFSKSMIAGSETFLLEKLEDIQASI